MFLKHDILTETHLQFMQVAARNVTDSKNWLNDRLAILLVKSINMSLLITNDVLIECYDCFDHRGMLVRCDG